MSTNLERAFDFQISCNYCTWKVVDVDVMITVYMNSTSDFHSEYIGLMLVTLLVHCTLVPFIISAWLKYFMHPHMYAIIIL